MNRLLLLMMMFYSGYSFCGCTDYGYITLNGKLVSCFCPPSNGGSPNIPIDSSYHNGNDTIDPNNTILDIVPAGGANQIWITYNNNGVDSPAISNNGVFTPEKTGTYYIQILEDYGNCEVDFTLSFVVLNTTGISNINNESSKLKVLSNPISSTLNLNSQQTINHINIYDELGRLQLSNQPITTSQYNYQVGVDALTKGVYVVEATLATNKKDYIKIVKQ